MVAGMDLFAHDARKCRGGKQRPPIQERYGDGIGRAVLRMPAVREFGAGHAGRVERVARERYRVFPDIGSECSRVARTMCGASPAPTKPWGIEAMGHAMPRSGGACSADVWRECELGRSTEGLVRGKPRTYETVGH